MNSHTHEDIDQNTIDRKNNQNFKFPKNEKTKKEMRLMYRRTNKM